MKLPNFINNKLSKFLITKTYNSEIYKYGLRNQMQIDNLFANNGIDL